ncbi:MAG: aspartyl protease family protein [Acidobacteriota bacterium]|nr:aspartyl protease family protein [Acidobacteriota bacterium]MDH3786108.1 aspartyl protease family protein [Acidobacteriota bacterium]
MIAPRLSWLVIGLLPLAIGGAVAPGESVEWMTAARSAVADGPPAEQRRALTQAESWLLDHPEDRVARTIHAELALRVGELLTAEDAIAALLENEDGLPAAAYRVAGMLAIARGDHATAQRLAEDGLADYPDDLPLLFWSAEAAASRADALKRLRRYVARGPDGGADPDRLTAARGTIAVYEALGDTAVWRRSQAPESGVLALRPLWSSNKRLQGYLLRVPAARGRRPIRLLLDSGSTGLFLTSSAARRLNFEPMAETTTFGGGGEGRHRSRRGLVPRLALGDLVYENAMATVTPGALDAGGRYDGLVGLQPFADYLLTLDGENRELRFTQTDEALDGERYWNFSGQMLVRGVAADGVRGLFVFDTGAYETLVSRTFADRLTDVTILEGGAVRGFGGRMRGLRVVDGGRVGFMELSTNDRRLVALDLAIASRLGGVELAGYLGLDLLGETLIEVDLRTQRVRVRRP